MWEIRTRETPYKDVRGGRVTFRDKIKGGKRPDILYSVFDGKYAHLIVRCWLTDPRARPTFEEIVPRLDTMYTTIPSAVDDVAE